MFDGLGVRVSQVWGYVTEQLPRCFGRFDKRRSCADCDEVFELPERLASISDLSILEGLFVTYQWSLFELQAISFVFYCRICLAKPFETRMLVASVRGFGG